MMAPRNEGVHQDSNSFGWTQATASAMLQGDFAGSNISELPVPCMGSWSSDDSYC